MDAEERMEELEQAVRDITARYNELGSILADFVENSGGPGPAEPGGHDHGAEPEREPVFCSWADRAGREDWEALMDWTDWFMTTYRPAENALVACWPRHPSAVEEVAALKMAWEQAVAACDDEQWRGTEALAYWHDRYVPGFFSRLNRIHGLNQCRTRHEERKGRTVITDREGAVIAATGENVA